MEYIKKRHKDALLLCIIRTFYHKSRKYPYPHAHSVAYPFHRHSLTGYTAPMQNELKNGYIVLNTGTSTREDFKKGIPNSPLASYRTKEMMLHLDARGSQTFFYQNTPTSLHANYVFLRLRATDAHFCGMIVEYLAHNRIPTNDPVHHSYPHSAEKISQMMLLSLNGIRIPETYVFREEAFEANADYLIAHLQFPLVFKVDGSKGRNVKILNSFEELRSEMYAKHQHRLAIVQPFIENTFDTRTLVFEGEILGSISRTRTTGYLNNISQGAIPARYELSEAEKTIAREAAKACRIDFGGVDMIHTEEGPVVLEVNKSPQVGGFQSVYDFKVFTKIAELIAKKHS
jgi:RimK family alpha-L-glutamate ligase